MQTNSTTQLLKHREGRGDNKLSCHVITFIGKASRLTHHTN